MSKKTPSDLLERLAAWCERYEVSQSELARLLGTKPSTVTEWVKRRNYPGGKWTLAILELLKTKPKRKKISSEKDGT
jgi:DNA-binding transcriptional regulator YiaG